MQLSFILAMVAWVVLALVAVTVYFTVVKPRRYRRRIQEHHRSKRRPGN